MCKVLFVLLGVLAIANNLVTADTATGVQIVGKVLRQYIKSQPDDLRISDGVHLVSVRSGENEARSAGDDGTLLGAVENYLQHHELRIRLPELMPGEGFGRAFKTAMDGIEDNEAGKFENQFRQQFHFPIARKVGIVMESSLFPHNFFIIILSFFIKFPIKSCRNGWFDCLLRLGVSEARGGGGGGGGGGKGGGGGGGIIVLGLMMGKMLAALGIGGVGLLALKALMVSALALMLSTIIGLKKLVHSGHEEHGHTVIHASHGHGHEYRKKREAAAEMAYKAWQEYKSR